MPDIVPMAGGVTPVLSPALFSTQLRVPSKSSEIPNQAVFPLVTLFVCPQKNCSVFLIPYSCIHFVTLFQNRNTLSTAEGLCLPPFLAVAGSSRHTAFIPLNFRPTEILQKCHGNSLAVASLSPYGVTSLAPAENPTQACHGPCRV